MFLHERDNPVCMLTRKHGFLVHVRAAVDPVVASQPKVYYTKVFMNSALHGEKLPIGYILEAICEGNRAGCPVS